MARMRAAKTMVRSLLEGENWRETLSLIAEGGVTNIGPLFSFLLLDPRIMHRAAVALGQTTAALALKEPEKARNIVRRYMWHLSEESGNIGWGIPEAFAETIVASPLLAKEYQRILITYIIDLGREDNFCDNAQLRRSCYWACGRVAGANPESCETWRQWLKKGLADDDVICRGMSCWALSNLPPSFMDEPAIRALAREGHPEECLLFDGNDCFTKTVTEIAEETLLLFR